MDFRKVSSFNPVGLEEYGLFIYLPILKWPWWSDLKIYIFTALLRKS